MPRFVILSDLHLPPVERLGNFSAGSQLVEFFTSEADRQRKASASTTLILAGDTIDFLLLPERPVALPWGLIPDLVDGALARLEEDHPRWMPGVFSALRQFTENGGELVLLPGNHDPEWLHPDTTALLASRTGPVTVHREAGPWRRTCGEWQVTVAHGDAWDGLNRIPLSDYQEDMAQARESKLPAGSRLVLKVFNPLKQAMLPDGRKRFAFLDALKPEMPAVLLILLYLDAPLVLRYLPAAGGIWMKNALVRKLRALLRGGYVFSSEAPGPGNSGDEDRLADEMIQALHDELSVKDGPPPATAFAVAQVEQFERWLTEGAEEKGVRTFAAAHNGIARAMLRAAMKRFAANSPAFFDPTAQSEEDRKAIQSLLPPRSPGDPPRVFITGHTHAARRLSPYGDPQNLYLNTGTWTDLVEFPCSVSGPEVEAFVDHLEAGTYQRRRRLTWAEVTPERGPELHGL